MWLIYMLVTLIATGIFQTIFPTAAMNITLDSADEALSHLTVAQPNVETAGDKLLFKTKSGLILLSFGPNSSTARTQLLINGSFTDVAHESVHGEIVTLVEYGKDSQAIMLWDADDLLRPRSLNLRVDPCWSAADFENKTNSALLVSFDWIWRNVYILTECDSIHVCNIVSLKCNFVLHVESSGSVTAMFVHPKLGLMFYVNAYRGIYRVNMDDVGSSLSLIVRRANSILGTALDYESSRLYWNDKTTQCLISCDMDGSLDFSPSACPVAADTKLLFNVAGIHRDMLYSTKSSDEFLSVQKKNLTDERSVLWKLRQVFPKRGTDKRALLLKERGQRYRANDDPCSSITCNQVCVPSSQNPGQPACRREEAKLLVTTTDALHVVDLNGPSAGDGETVIGNLSNPRGITYDFRGGYIFWSEDSGHVTVIKRHSLRDGSTTPVLTHETLGYMDLQAMAYDWLAGNMYMVFEETRCIHVCSITEATQKCTEILVNNKMADNVGGLALNPDYRQMFWTRRHYYLPLLVIADMDGSYYRILSTKEMISPGGIGIDFKTSRLLWVDSTRGFIGSMELNGSEDAKFEMGKHDYLPQHLGLHENGLFVAGSKSTSSRSSGSGIFFKNAKYGENLVLNFSTTTIRSFAVYNSLSQPNYNQESNCKNHPCPGICLLSGLESFRCACPTGQKSLNNGTTCEVLEDPRVIFSTAEGLFVRDSWDADNRLVHSGPELSLQSIAHSVERQLIWVAGNDGQHIYEMEGVTFNRTGNGLYLRERSVKSGTLTYDWIGNNLVYTYMRIPTVGNNFFNISIAIVICSLEYGDCVDTGNRTGLGLDGQFALDPNLGFMYWCTESDLLMRAEMDGSGNHHKIMSGCRMGSVAVDHETHALFWINSGNSIASCDSQGNNARSLARLAPDWVIKIAVRGNSVFWVTMGRLYSCAKDNCDGLRGRKLSGARMRDVYVDHPSSQPIKRKNPCSGHLCSHICVPTSTNYMRCLCPPGQQLSSDGRNCECRGPDPCDDHYFKPKKPLPLASAAMGPGHNCSAGDAFQCLNSTRCVNISKVCDGKGDCPYLSDEGPRCNETCPPGFGCSYSCVPTPYGPTCVCPYGETLDYDKRKCAYFKIRDASVKGPVAFLVLGPVALILLVVSIVAVFKYRQTKSMLRNLTPGEVNGFLMGDAAASDTAPDGEEKATALPFTQILEPDSLIIAREKILGSGAFGVVYAGLLSNSVPVAVKTFKGTLDVEEFMAVLAEVKIMAYLGDHEHVVKFLGADVSQITERKIMAVTELSPHGDLRHYLWKCAVTSDVVLNLSGYTVGVGTVEIVPSDLVNWCEQIADGMEYLAIKKIIHGDLAARNVLVFSHNVLKISDFGLSKKLYACKQYTMKRKLSLPWKWASIELLTLGQFSEASDVWSFGVTAWEIFTLGDNPYDGMRYGDGAKFIDYLQQGNRLAKPQEATDEIYRILLQCWVAEASARPTFSFLKGIFQEKGIATSRNSGQSAESATPRLSEPANQVSAVMDTSL